MQTKHSPAPFKIGDEYGSAQDEIEDSEGRCIAVVWTRRCPGRNNSGPRACFKDDPVGIANANLFVAAPEMLSELQSILRCYDRDNIEARQYDSRSGREAVNVVITKAAAARIRELLAKAKGEVPA